MELSLLLVFVYPFYSLLLSSISIYCIVLFVDVNIPVDYFPVRIVDK